MPVGSMKMHFSSGNSGGSFVPGGPGRPKCQFLWETMKTLGRKTHVPEGCPLAPRFIGVFPQLGFALGVLTYFVKRAGDLCRNIRRISAFLGLPLEHE